MGSRSKKSNHSASRNKELAILDWTEVANRAAVATALDIARRKGRKAPARSNPSDDIQVLCGCGWGRLRCPVDEVPAECPVCGMSFDREVVVDDMADDVLEENPRIADARRVELPKRRSRRWWTRRNDGVALQRYVEFSPTAFDPRGLSARSMGHHDSDRSEWFVAPVVRTRDSGALETSNFSVVEAMLDEIDADGLDHETHRFGHWGPGWFEIIVVRPGSESHRRVLDVAADLERYPILDEEDLSRREVEAEIDAEESGVDIDEELDVELSDNPRGRRGRRAARSASPVDLRVEKGRLRIVLEPDSKDDVEALLDMPADQAFAELVEWHLGNGWELLNPAEIGAITESPILSREVERDENGNLVSVGKVYWYPEYEAKSELEELLKHGEIVLRQHSASVGRGPRRAVRRSPRLNGPPGNGACRGCGAPGWGVGAEGLCPACWSPSKHSGPTCSRCGEKGSGSLETFAFTHRCRGRSGRRPNGPRLHAHSCPPDGSDSRGRCVGICDCGEHFLLTGRYTPYCPSCQTCHACGCPEVDGFSHYEGCQLESTDLPRLPRPSRRRNEERRPRSVGRSAPLGIKSLHGGSLLVVEVDIGIDDSIGDVLSDPNVTDAEIDAALASFAPARTFDVRRDVEEILRRAGIKAKGRYEEVGGAMRFVYQIPSTHDPKIVANALKNYFKGQRDVRVSIR